MRRRRRPLTGTAVVAVAPTAQAGFTFPGHLVHPPQSQLTRSEDAVSDRIGQLDSWAQRLGEGFGITFTTFVLNPLPAELPNSNGWVIAAAMMRELAHRAERVSIERRNSRWGLFFTRDPAALAQDRRSDAVPLKDAPLDVRERFLAKSDEFFRAYLALCEQRLGRMKACVSHADQTLQLLGEMRLE